MAAASRGSAPLNKRGLMELAKLEADPPTGISAWLDEDQTAANGMIVIRAQVSGPPDTPYAAGVFGLEVVVPPRYPLEPPRVRFVSPIWHPNIDAGGRICLDTLQLKPRGSWSPANSLSGALTNIRMLIESPNPTDPLMPDIASLMRLDRAAFNARAAEHTKAHATQHRATPNAQPLSQVQQPQPPAAPSPAVASPRPAAAAAAAAAVAGAVAAAPAMSGRRRKAPDVTTANATASGGVADDTGAVRCDGTGDADADVSDSDSDAAQPLHRRRRVRARRRPRLMAAADSAAADVDAGAGDARSAKRQRVSAHPQPDVAVENESVASPAAPAAATAAAAQLLVAGTDSDTDSDTAAAAGSGSGTSAHAPAAAAAATAAVIRSPARAIGQPAVASVRAPLSPIAAPAAVTAAVAAPSAAPSSVGRTSRLKLARAKKPVGSADAL